MILVINLGLKSIRAIIYTKEGRRIATAARRVQSRLNGDNVEQDAREWREKYFEVAREAIGSANARSSIDHVTVSCSASCIVPVDAAMEPLGPVIMVSDRRAADQGRAVAERPEFARLSQAYGYQASEYSQIARILWVKENTPNVYLRAAKFLAPNDFLIGLLTGGNVATDHLNAEKHFYDTDAQAYPTDLYDALGLDASLLPRVVPIGTPIGKMAPEMAASLGLARAPEVVVGTYDAICSVFGTGVSSAGKVCDVSGTVTSVRMYSDKKFKDPQSRIMCQHFPPSDGYLIGGSNNLGGGLIEWGKSCFYKDAPNPYEQMQTDSEKEQSRGGSRAGVIFIPHLLGARAPIWASHARGVMFGLERQHDRGDLIRAVFESVAFSIRDFLEIFGESGTRPDMITASGGLAKIMIANEIKASVTGLPYHFMDEFESTALGAAIIVMCATGQFASYQEACDEIVVTKQIFLPRRQDKAYYDDMYGLYRELSASVDGLFLKRQAMLARHRLGSLETIENL